MDAAKKGLPRNDKAPGQGRDVVTAEGNFNKPNSTLTTILYRVDYSLVAALALLVVAFFSVVTGGGLNHA